MNEKMDYGVIQKIEKKKKKWLDTISSAREMVLANLSMISQIPAQTFNERDRAQFILSRFTESGVPDPKTDKLHNAIGIYNGKHNAGTVLIFAHMDNQFGRTTDQNITITEDRVYGAGVADDNLALAVLLTLPDIFRRLEFEQNFNIVLLATTRFHGRGDFGGMQHFIKEHTGKIDTAINLNGITLGALNYFTLSRLRCDIRCEMNQHHESPWFKMSESSAILVINDIIDNLFSISLPRKPKTVLNIGMISGGERYSTLSREASVHLEALGEDDALMNMIEEEIRNRCTDVGAKHGADIAADFFGRHKASYLTSGHPLIKNTSAVIRSLGFNPHMEYTNSEISLTLAENIPSVSIGLTRGQGGGNSKSYVEIEPLGKGILQLIMLLQSIEMEGI